jgi:hypothetical protein
MTLTAYLRRRSPGLKPAAAALVALLQRSPALRLAAAADEWVTASPIGTLLKSAALGLASMGAVDSVAGATLLATTLNPDPTGNLPPFNCTVGDPITPLGFTIANLITIGSWTVDGAIPPGLILTTVQPNGGTLINGGGVLDATSPTNDLTTPILEGTPTTPGIYSLTMQGFWKGGESGGPYGGKGVSSIFPFMIIVSGTTPTFTTQPISATVTGGRVALSIVATQAVSYQWMLNGSTPVAGATGPILVIGDAASGAGTYTCVASNAMGSTTSSPANVSLAQTTNVGRLTNISTRSLVGTGQNILIAGFVVGGAGTSGQKSLLIRGSGPALVPFGVSGTLPDPQLQLYSSADAVLGSNDAWGGGAAISNVASAVGAFAWSLPTSSDAALLETLPEGGYTAQIAGESGDLGIALAEVYDATPPAAYSPATPRIVNLSVRADVGAGANILIAGFAIGGSTSRTVLIRASGPALANFGLTGTLRDPQLQLFSGTTVLESNNGWGGDPQIAAAAASVGAFSWQTPTSNDSAVLVTLPPGPYTVQVSGADGGGGTALVEVYEIP